MAAAYGAAIPLVDHHNGFPCVLVPLLSIAGIAFGFVQPVAPWRWALATLVGLSLSPSHASIPGFLDRPDLRGVATMLVATVYLTALLRRTLPGWRARSVAYEA